MQKFIIPIKPILYVYPFLKRIKGRDVVFIHIPKTGGTSISRGLNLKKPIRALRIQKHYSAMQIKQAMSQEMWDRSYSFCFVRNPWARLYSHYSFRKRRNRLKGGPDISFTDWAEGIYRREDHLRNFRSQLDWITDEEGQIMVSSIGRFEQIEEDFNAIHKEFDPNGYYDLPHINSSASKTTYHEHYNQVSKDIVAELYHKDIDHFGYSF